MLIDWDLTGESALTRLRQIKAEHPDIRCVMLVNSYKAELLARADAVLFKGFSTTELTGHTSHLWHDRPAHQT